MRPRVKLLVLFLLIVAGVFVAGCGGDPENQSGGQEDGGNTTGDSAGGSGDQGQKKPETKIALGSIRSVNTDTKGFSVEPTRGEEAMVFKLRPKARIILDGKEATFEDMEKGQQAQVRYISGEKIGQVRAVELFSEDSGGGETTG